MGSGFEKFLNRYGSEMVLERQGRKIRAFLQKSGSVAWEYVQQKFSPLGSIPGGRYVYIGPPEPRVQEGDILTLGETAYEIRRAETVLLGDKALYCWGLCVQKGGADTWGS